MVLPKMTVAQKREFLVEMCNCREYLKTDVELNKAVLKKHLKFLPQQKLYKFRACIEREFRMLEENCIWMSLASSFPDPFDHTINIDLVKNRREVKEWLGKNGSSLCFEVVKRLFEEKGLACRYGSDAQYIACSKSVYSKGKKSFPPREPRVNYEELRAASDASYFAMLFDKKAAKQMLEDLTRYAGNPNVTVEELWENKISAEIHWSSPLMYLQYSIYNYVENKNSLVINFLQCVQWESFVLQEAQHMLSNTKNLKVFAWQRDTLIDIAQKTVEGSDILDAVK